CATPLGEGMEVMTHSPDALQARQFVLQMYLIDHALDCPTCDKSGECYLQDNTYLHNINANPYRRPKLSQPYEHFSPTIDYKWDRCIMCNRCTRVCDEVIGVTAIESANRSLEATITPAFGMDLSDGTCTNCGMCIAVCPVGALTDRHFGHHPWELDTTETICGFCDGGCTINVESNKGIVRRTTHLWERGVNHGYTCEKGQWGHEQIQSPSRLFYPRIREENGDVFESTWEEAIARVADQFGHYQGSKFATLASGENTNEEAYALQQFSRAVMQSNNVNRFLSPAQSAVERVTRQAFGVDVSSTNNLQELFTAAKNIMVVGPSIFEHAPIVSYWINHSRLYRESRIVVVSTDRYPLCDRAAIWLKPNEGTTNLLLDAIGSVILSTALLSPTAATMDGYAELAERLGAIDLESVATQTGVPVESITDAAKIFVTGDAEFAGAIPDGGFVPAAVFHTLAHVDEQANANAYGDPALVAAACANLASLTGNVGRAGGGVASMRGPANYQGTTDMGLTPDLLPGGATISDANARGRFEDAWSSRWVSEAITSNGFVQRQTLPTTPGIELDALVDAIDAGTIEAMWIEGGYATRHEVLDSRLYESLKKLKYLVVVDAYDSPLTAIADVVLPLALNLEKDGTFTSYDRTVQRVRAAVPPMGESRSELQILGAVAAQLGYSLAWDHPAQAMTEISRLVPDYAGVTYARLERGGIVTPVATFGEQGETVLTTERLSSRFVNLFA
ncbi:MAG TPA: molybdopterin-dependent oxidoreductase, partial [Thermomicrobiales bacterium]|nr:molybdopterin-dependent oxidoreductase [Thermomicrobiales bacterium]